MQYDEFVELHVRTADCPRLIELFTEVRVAVGAGIAVHTAFGVHEVFEQE